MSAYEHKHTFGVIVAVLILAAVALFTYVAPAGTAEVKASPEAVASFQYIEHVDGVNHLLAIMQAENKDIPYTDVEKAETQAILDDVAKALEAHDYDKVDDLGGQLLDLARKVADRADKKAA